jgi:import receptor subunit TOM70
MYEKASFPDLALSDCDAVLELDPSHVKARTRRLRILESQKRYREALVEVCALQLKYMNDNRDKLRLGLPPTGPPPVPQSKIEELVTFIQPEEIQRAQESMSSNDVECRALPSSYTILQLLKSFSGYNKWMGEAAKGGTVAKFSSQLDDLLEGVPRKSTVAFADNIATKAILLLNRGRRYAFEKDFVRAVKDFDNAFALVEDKNGSAESDHDDVKKQVMTAMGNDNYFRLLEWCGMSKHLRFDLKGALECYERCSELEPENTEILVKRAGVKMDGSNHSDAEKLFAEALALNPTAPDALLHRANLHMLQQRVPASEKDLETCIRLYPNNLLARLRLATVYMAKEDLDGAKRMLEKAEEYDPDSSEVHCYRGELHFAKGDFSEAKDEFQKAMECDASNPTPYVNAALAVVNTPSAMGTMPDFSEAIRLLEKAIEVDPMFHAAYVQLGQMKLSMATDLSKAREVVELYDRGLEYCRTPEELKDICCMRILTVAQIDAAHALHMETLNMQ